MTHNNRTFKSFKITKKSIYILLYVGVLKMEPVMRNETKMV